jgi:hypothetical protein
MPLVTRRRLAGPARRAPAPVPVPVPGDVPGVLLVSRRLLRGVWLAAAVVLSGALVAGCSAAPSSTSAAARTSSSWTQIAVPEQPAASPPTPSTYRPTPAAAQAWLSGDTSTPTGADAAPGSDQQAGTQTDSFCSTARTELSFLGRGGVAGLTSLIGRVGDSAPRLRDFVRQAQDDVGSLQASAPPGVRDSAQVLASAWSTLSQELENVGYRRGEAVALVLKYLASPAVAAAWEVVTKYATTHCGVDPATW